MQTCTCRTGTTACVGMHVRLRFSLLRPGLCRAVVKSVCSEYKIHNADVHMRDDCDVDDLVDVIEGSRVYIPCIYVINKIDQITLEELTIIGRCGSSSVQASRAITCLTCDLLCGSPGGRS